MRDPEAPIVAKVGHNAQPAFALDHHNRRLKCPVAPDVVCSHLMLVHTFECSL